MCIDGKCYNLACDRCDSCPAGLKCEDSKCVSDKCNSNKDCQKTFVCHDAQKVCVQHFVSDCEYHIHCPKGAGYCINNLCTRSPPIVPCVEDSDCPKMFEKCSPQKQCISPHPKMKDIVLVGCLFSTQCPENQICVSNWCRDKSNIVFPENHQNFDCLESSTECTHHKDCKDSERCFYGKCKFEVPTGCYASPDCPRDSPMCINSLCQKQGKELCSDITDCGPTYGSVICNDMCRPLVAEPYNPPMTECTYNTQCKKKQWCVNGKCVNFKPEGGCEEHTECSNGEKCFNNICKKITSPLDGCITDADCPKTHPQCYLYKCHTNRGNWCDVNKDCFAHTPICIGGLCTANVPSCKEDSDCPLETNKCLKGKCTAETPDKKCKTHKDCPKEKKFCFQGECIYDVYEWCVDDQECHHKSPLKTNGHCLKNNWCNATMGDNSFVEKTPPWMSTECSRDTDCTKDNILKKCLRYKVLNLYIGQSPRNIFVDNVSIDEWFLF